MKDDPTGQTVVFMLLWTSQYSTYVWPGMLCFHVHHSPSSCTEVFPWPLKYVLFFSFSLFRFDSTFSCAAEEIWGSESSPSGVHLCRLGVSQFKGKNETCNMNDCQNQARIGFHFLSTLYLWLVAYMIRICMWCHLCIVHFTALLSYWNILLVYFRVFYYCRKCLWQQAPSYSDCSAPHVCGKKSKCARPVALLWRSTGNSLRYSLIWGRELFWSLNTCVLADHLHHSHSCPGYTAGRRLSGVPQSSKLGPNWPDPKWKLHRWYFG